MVFALVAIPILVATIGVERFGMLALIWALIGSFGIFDLGLGRALTQEISAAVGAERENDVPALVRSYLRLLAIAGAVGGVLAWITCTFGAKHALNVDPWLREEVLDSVPLLAIALPFVVLTTGLRGALEAYQSFGILTAIRVALNAATFLAPLLLLPFTHSLVALVATLLVARVLATAAHLRAARRVLPESLKLGGRTVPARRIWRFARWMAITNVVGPLMVQMDRFAIGFALSASAVAYYAAPSDLIVRIAVVPLAIVSVLFPALATSYAMEPAAAERLSSRGSRLLAVILIPVMLVLFVYAPELLSVWLGESFSDAGTPILRWLAVGALINSIGQMPFALIQAAGRPDLTGRLHLLELPLYLLALWAALEWWGLVGVAAVWCARALFDTIAMFAIAHRVLGVSRATECRVGATVGAAFTAPTLLALLGTEDLLLRGGALLLGLVCLATAIHAGLMERGERAALTRTIRELRPARGIRA